VVTTQLVQAIQVRDLASRLEGSASESLARSASAAIDDLLDDLGKPRFPPGPPKPWWNIVSSLSFMANSLQEGSLKQNLLDVAAKVLDVVNRP